MSEAIHFDTHKFVKRMTESGMAEKTAEALADEQMRLIQGELATKQDLALVHQDIEALRLATKRDIEALRKDTTQSIEVLRKETKQSIEQLRKDTTESIEALRKDTTESIEALRKDTKQDLKHLESSLLLKIEQTKSESLRWMAGMFIAQGGLIVALIRLIPA